MRLFRSRNMEWEAWESYIDGGHTPGWTSRISTFSGPKARSKAMGAVRRWINYTCCIGYSKREGVDKNDNSTIIEVKWHCHSSMDYHTWKLKGKPKKR